MEVLTIEIDAVGIFTAIQGKACRVQTGTQGDIESVRPNIFADELLDRLGAGRFVAVDSGRDINAAPAGCRPRPSFQRDALLGCQQLLLPAVTSGRLAELAQGRMDVDGFTAVRVAVQSERHHGLRGTDARSCASVNRASVCRAAASSAAGSDAGGASAVGLEALPERS